MNRLSARSPRFEVHLRRLGVAPDLRVLASGPTSTRVAIDGLVCGLCAARTRNALAGVPGINAVYVDLEHGLAELTHQGGVAPALGVLRRALASVVVAGAARRALGRAVAAIQGAAE